MAKVRDNLNNSQVQARLSWISSDARGLWLRSGGEQMPPAPSDYNGLSVSIRLAFDPNTIPVEIVSELAILKRHIEICESVRGRVVALMDAHFLDKVKATK